MIDQDQLKELIKLMVDNELTELDLQDESQCVSLKRQGSAVPQPVYMQPPPAVMGAESGSGTITPQLDTTSVGMPSTGDPQAAIESPMVGTFYAAATPEAQPFVKPGDQVDPDTVVCIIEAMKVFNEIKAEVSGTVDKVLIDNGQAVEFGQPLFTIQPA